MRVRMTKTAAGPDWVYMAGETWKLEPALAESLRGADQVFVYQSPEVKWDVADAMQPLGSLATVHKDLGPLTEALANAAQPGDHLVLMSNGSFGGLHERLLTALRAHG